MACEMTPGCVHGVTPDSGPPALFPSISPERTIAALTRQIEAFVAAADTPVCLAIDGLSEALAAGIDEAALDAFLRSCRSLVEVCDWTRESRQSVTSSTLLNLTHCIS